MANQKKETKKVTVKEKKTVAKKKKEKEHISLWERIVRFFVGLKKELKRVHFPSRKDLIKYSIATVVFVIFFALFFYAIDVLFAFLQSLGK